MPLFKMSPPNEDCICSSYNPESLESVRSLEVSTGKLRRIVDDPFWKPTEPHDIVRPTLWDGELASRLLCNYKPAIQALEQLESVDWSFSFRGKLRTAIKQCFEKEYFKAFEQQEYRYISFFFRETPEYGGVVRGFTKDDYVSGREWKFQPQHITRTMYCVERYMNLIVEWCMSYFSHYRGDWGWCQEFEPLDLEQYEETDVSDSLLTEKERRRKERLANKKPRLTSKDKRAAMLANMKPEERKMFLAMEATRKANLAYRRMGKTSQDVIDFIE